MIFSSQLQFMNISTELTVHAVTTAAATAAATPLWFISVSRFPSSLYRVACQEIEQVVPHSQQEWADSERFLLQITSAELCNTERAGCNSTVTFTSMPTAFVDVRNIGTVAGVSMVTIANCSYPILPVPSQYPTLAASQSTKLLYQVLSSLNLAFPAVKHWN